MRRRLRVAVLAASLLPSLLAPAAPLRAQGARAPSIRRCYARAALAQHRAVSRRPRRRGERRRRAIRARSTSARSAAACGRAPTPGRTWAPIMDSQPVASIGALAVAPSDPNTVYVGSGEADMRSDIQHGNGMYRSTDAGATLDAHRPGGLALRSAASWSTRTIPRRCSSRRSAIRTARTTCAASTAPPTAARPGRARCSTTATPARSTSRAIPTMRTVYASLWQTRRPPWSVYPPSNGPGTGCTNRPTAA